VTTYAGQDVRGLARPATGRDIGSYEVEATGSGFRPLRRAEVGLAAIAAPTVSGATLSAGVNGGSSLTFAGTLGQVNAVLATLTYQAPASGSSATLSVQANDGSAANNLSTTFTTTITLAPSLVVTVAAGQTVVDSTVRSGAVQLVKQGAGTLVLSAAETFSGGTVVEQGEVVIRNTAALGSGSLAVRAGAKATLDIGAATLPIPALTLDATGRIDLGKGGIVLAGGWNASDLRTKILAGLGDGSWNGTSGITSSVAAATPYRAVGWIDNGDGTATIAFAAEGDTNLDGLVDISDLQNILASGMYGTGADATWADGDFNLDAVVDISDLQDILAGGLYGKGAYNVQQQPAVLTAAAPAPQTSTVTVDPLALAFAINPDATTSSTKKKPA